MSKSWIMIKYIENPVEIVQLTAVRNNPIAIEVIDNPTEKVRKRSIHSESNRRNTRLERISPMAKSTMEKNDVIERIKFRPWAIAAIDRPSESLQELAVTLDPDCLGLIRKPTKRIQLMAISKSPNLISEIKRPSEELQLAAVNIDGRAIQYIKRPTERVCYEAINNAPSAIMFIRKPSYDIKMHAIRVHSCSIGLINEQTEEMQLLALRTCPNEAINDMVNFFIFKPASETVKKEMFKLKVSKRS